MYLIQIFHVHWDSDSLLELRRKLALLHTPLLAPFWKGGTRETYITFFLVYRNIFLCIHSTLQYYDHTFSSFIPICRTQQRLFIESDSVFRERYAPIIRRLYPNGLS